MSFVTSFFTGVELAKELYRKATSITGTLCRNRKGLPQALKKKSNLDKLSITGKTPFLTLSYREKNPKRCQFF